MYRQYNSYNVNFYYIEKNYFYPIKNRTRNNKNYEMKTVYNNQHFKNMYKKNNKKMRYKNETKKICKMLNELNKENITIFDLIKSNPNLKYETLWTITANKYINNWNILSKVFVADFLQ